MTVRWPRLVGSVACAALLAATFSIRVAGQAPQAPPTTAVLVNLTIKPDVDRAAVTKVLPDEVRDTVKAYLDGRIQQWYSRADGRGVLFILNSHSTDEAKAVMEALPLAKANLVNLEYTALGPLTPLRALLAPPRDAGSKEQR